MNLLSKKNILYVILTLYITVNLLGQGVPNQNSKWMLLAPNDKCFYLDGFNKTNAWTDSLIVYDSRALRESFV